MEILMSLCKIKLHTDRTTVPMMSYEENMRLFRTWCIQHMRTSAVELGTKISK